MKVALLGIAALLSFGQARVPEADAQITIGEQHYRIYRGDGTAATMDELVKAVGAAEVTFIGEFHHDRVAHYLEEQLLRRTWDARLALSLEMFERDVQCILDEYLAGLIVEKNLITDGPPGKTTQRTTGPWLSLRRKRKCR